ncbi:MAG: non-hydrolyzing UDP-N-acetylglucosamine 2-epimerase, partial [Acutalibacteraceae bacterium]
AAVSRVLREKHTEILVHTGQHYDKDMSDVFFEELSIPKPNFNLGVGSGSHGKQTGEMLEKIEELVISEKPDKMLVYGDTNSTLAGALAASKLLVPVAHVEAGLRSFNMSMPEEQNRILTDRISSQLFCPTDTAVKNLAAEGITQGVCNTGDVMYDALSFYGKKADGRYLESWFDELDFVFEKPEKPNEFYLATVHRAENTDGKGKLLKILNAFEKLDAPVIFPVHPRTMKLVSELTLEKKYRNILFCRPVGYIHLIFLAKHAKKIVTDSGGLQKEAFLLKTPCVTVRDQTEWVETLQNGCNILSSPETDEIVKKVLSPFPDFSKVANCFGNADAAKIITDLI